MSKLDIENINKSFGELNIFNDFNISFPKNKISCILGSSGCGKTTLLNMISGLIPSNSGYITDINSSSISYIFQEPRLLDWFTVKENLDFILKDIYPKNEREKIIEKYLGLVSLYDFKNYYPKNLSGGMKQRLSIARAFAYPSDLLLMDEPFKGLDNKLKTSLMKSFLSLWNSDKRTVIFVTHDIDESLYIGDEIFVFKGNPVKISQHIVLNSNDNNINCNDDKKDMKNLIISSL